MKKIISIFFVMLLIAVSCGCGDKASDINYNGDKKSESLDTWEAVNGNAVVNVGNLNMEIFAETGEVKVIDNAENRSYSSGSALIGNGKEAEIAELSLTYYDSQSIEYTLNSRENSFNTEIYKKGNSVRVKYHIRKDAIEYIVPKALTVETFEEITSKLDASEKSKLKRYYNHIKSEGKSSQVEALKQKYPYLKKHDLYIVYDNLMNDEKEAITNLMIKAGYTMDRYLEDAKSMGIDSSQLDITPSFTVILEYSLNEYGLEVKCLTDLIEMGNSQFVLQGISILKGFGALSGSRPSFLLADGSGGIVKTVECFDENFEAKVYGDNPVIASDNTATLMQSYRMPVFGYSSSAGSYLAVITNAAEVARVIAQTRGSKNTCDSIYPAFALQDMDKMSIRPGSNMFDVNYYSNKNIEQCPAVLYCFGKADMTDIDFAEQYREYLLKQNNETEKPNGGALWLEFTGYTVVKTNIAGIPINKKIALSTISSIQDVVDKLHTKGIRNIYLKLKDFGNGGKKHGVANTFELDKIVGTKEELTTLAESLSKYGGKIYLENDVVYSYVDNAFDGFSGREDSSHTLSGGIAYDKQFNVVELNYEKALQPRYIISPVNYRSYFEGFIKKLNKKMKDVPLSVSWSSGGNLLVADYKKSVVVDRIGTLGNVESAFGLLNDNFGKLMTSGGNIYALKYAEAITDVPLYNSNLTIETDNSLFYQTVLHGLVGYSGESISTSLYPDELVLRSVESGAALFYSLITEKNAYVELDMSKDMVLLPPSAEKLVEEISDNAVRLSEFYKTKADSSIKAHTELAKDVYKTEYSNSIFSIVNYGDTDYQNGNITVKACDYYLSEVAE